MFKSGRKWDKMFLGTYEHSIDSKNRLSLPSRIVSKINEDVVVSKGFDGCLELRTLSAFEVYSEKLMQLSQNKKDSRIVYIIIPTVKKAMIKIIKFLIKFLICFFFKSGDMTSLKKNFKYNSELQISHFGKTYFPLVLLISITSVNHFFMHS